VLAGRGISFIAEKLVHRAVPDRHDPNHLARLADLVLLRAVAEKPTGHRRLQGNSTKERSTYQLGG